jgi:hypothetical protein
LRQDHRYDHPEDHGFQPAHEPSADLADRGFRASDADQAAFHDRFGDYQADRMRLHRKRGRDQLGDGIDDLTEVDIVATEKMLQMDHQTINERLRAGDPAIEKDLVVRNAVSALHKLPDAVGPVHRGIQFDRPGDLQEFLDRYEVGSTVREKAFTHSDKQLDSSHRGNVKLHIDARHGKDVNFLRDPHIGIQEVVHPPHTDFFPTAKHYDAETSTWHVYVRDHSGPLLDAPAPMHQPDLPGGAAHGV